MVSEEETRRAHLSKVFHHEWEDSGPIPSLFAEHEQTQVIKYWQFPSRIVLCIHTVNEAHAFEFITVKMSLISKILFQFSLGGFNTCIEQYRHTAVLLAYLLFLTIWLSSSLPGWRSSYSFSPLLILRVAIHTTITTEVMLFTETLDFWSDTGKFSLYKQWNEVPLTRW